MRAKRDIKYKLPESPVNCDRYDRVPVTHLIMRVVQGV